MFSKRDENRLFFHSIGLITEMFITAENIIQPIVLKY